MTQEQLADLVGVSAQAVSKWENEDTMPDTALLLPLSDALSVSTDALLGKGTAYKTDVYNSLRVLARQTVAKDGGDALPELVWEMLFQVYEKTLWDTTGSFPPSGYDPEEMKNAVGKGSLWRHPEALLRIFHDEKTPYFYFLPRILFGKPADWSDALTPRPEISALFTALSDPDTIRALQWLANQPVGRYFEYEAMAGDLGLEGTKVLENLKTLSVLPKEGASIDIDGTKRTLYHGSGRATDLTALVIFASGFCHEPKNYWLQSTQYASNQHT